MADMDCARSCPVRCLGPVTGIVGIDSEERREGEGILDESGDDIELVECVGKTVASCNSPWFAAGVDI